MRHGKKVNHLGRKTAHRKAMLANMACSLIEHKRINTTVAKAKALKQFVEPLITKSKAENNQTTEKGTHNRRIVFQNLRDKYAVTELFSAVSEKVADRPGGYTRIIKLGSRLGDNADMAMIELVDFNEIYNADKPKKKTTRRSRRGSSAKAVPAPTAKEGEKTDPEVKPDAKTKAEPNAKAEPEVKADTAEKADVKTKAEPKTKADPSEKADAKAEPEVKAEPKAKADAAEKADAKAEPEVKAEPKAKADTSEKADAKAKAEPKAEADTAKKVDPQSKADKNEADGADKKADDSKE